MRETVHFPHSPPYPCLRYITVCGSYVLFDPIHQAGKLLVLGFELASFCTVLIVSYI